MGLFSSNPKLKGKRIAILATEGVEQVELTKPRRALDKAGAVTHLISPQSHIKGGKIKAWDMVRWGDNFKVDRTLAQASPLEYDALLLPGGVMNPDFLRMDEVAVRFVRGFVEAGKPMAAICHGPLDPDRGRSRRRPNHHLLALAQDRSSKRRRKLGRSGGCRRPRSRHQPQPQRPARLQQSHHRAVQHLRSGLQVSRLNTAAAQPGPSPCLEISATPR